VGVSLTNTAEYNPFFSARLFPLGAPGDGPPCIRQRPFGIAGGRTEGRPVRYTHSGGSPAHTRTPRPSVMTWKRKTAADSSSARVLCLARAHARVLVEKLFVSLSSERGLR
jgi:hypothetical protein